MSNSRTGRVRGPVTLNPRVKLTAGLGLAVGTALLAAACSSASSTAASAPASSGPAGSAPAGSGTSAAGAAVITTATSSAGTFLTSGSGRAVYLWVKDTKDASACSGACAGAWPPVTTGGSVTAGGSVKAGDLGTITRSGGTRQVTYDGHPLYYFEGDSGPGTASGQGSDSFGAKWWLVAPGGSEVTAAVSSFTAAGAGSAPASPAASSPSAGAGGY